MTPTLNTIRMMLFILGLSQFVSGFHAKKWKGEADGMCGNNGKVQLPALQQNPFTASLTTITQNRNIYFLRSGSIMHAFKRHHSEPRK
ncbi:hypothetical protein AVEN_56388-1 [Araneus ventricosus]|uniref:Secreted protein n=1 Tax=Araneus ventricosus TaxID=182803 RepID=A0A4Y2WII9_ARAVE|nr:hypothetical protein AVEN_56388-1 [Araneus ventricosus]